MPPQPSPYLQTAVYTMNPLELTHALLKRLGRDLRGTRQAFLDEDREAAVQHTDHALRVLGELMQSCVLDAPEKPAREIASRHFSLFHFWMGEVTQWHGIREDEERDERAEKVIRQVKQLEEGYHDAVQTHRVASVS